MHPKTTRIAWRVTLANEKKINAETPAEQTQFASGYSDIGPLEAWDQAISVAKEMDTIDAG